MGASCPLLYYYDYRYNVNVPKASTVSCFILSRFASPSLWCTLSLLLFASPDNSFKVFSCAASFLRRLSLTMTAPSLFSNSLWKSDLASALRRARTSSFALRSSFLGGFSPQSSLSWKWFDRTRSRRNNPEYVVRYLDFRCCYRIILRSFLVWG